MNSYVSPSLDTILSLHSSQGILMKFSSYCCPRTLFEGTIGMGSSFILSISPSVCLFVDTILSLQHLIVFKGLNFPVIVPITEDDHILLRSCCTDFYQSYFFLIFFYMKSWPCNTACSFQLIWMKPFSYYSHDLKRLILYQDALDYGTILTRFMAHS